MGTMRLLIDSRDRGSPMEVGIDQLGDLLADKENQVWLDIRDPGPAEVEVLRREFAFHELALEEVTKQHKRPRCDTYGNYSFIVVCAAEQTDKAFVPRELDLFWGDNFIVTLHRGSGAVLTVLAATRRRWEVHDRRYDYGVACLAHLLFDGIVDGYFAVQDRVNDQIQSIKNAIFHGADGAAEDLFSMREELLRVPRLLAPTSYVLSEVLRRERAIPEELRPYFVDVQDHAQHVLAELETYRDLLAAALDVHVFSAFNRLGIIMKRLTAVTVVIMVPNFVASIYGMNFTHPLPLANWEHGGLVVVAFLAIMVAWGFLHSRILGWL